MSLYLSFCRRFSINPDKPLCEDDLCGAMIFFSHSHKVTGLPSFVSAIAKWHELHNLGPLPRNAKFARIVRGLNNFFGLSETTQPKHALSTDDLLLIHRSMDLCNFYHVRDWCAYLFAFFGLLRLREFTDGGLLMRDVSFSPSHVALTIPFSKSNLQPVTIRLVSRTDSLCPVSALKKYLSFLPPSTRRSDSPFFISHPLPQSSRLSSKAFSTMLKARVVAVLHKDPSDYAGHSFRRGGATAMFLAGISDSVIARHGRWNSTTFRRYFNFTSQQEQLFPTQALAHSHTAHK